MVPLDGERTILDVMMALQLPLILVAGSYLGTISHTLTAPRRVVPARHSSLGDHRQRNQGLHRAARRYGRGDLPGALPTGHWAPARREPNQPRQPNGPANKTVDNFGPHFRPIAQDFSPRLQPKTSAQDSQPKTCKPKTSAQDFSPTLRRRFIWRQNAPAPRSPKCLRVEQGVEKKRQHDRAATQPHPGQKQADATENLRYPDPVVLHMGGMAKSTAVAMIPGHAEAFRSETKPRNRKPRNRISSPAGARR